MPGLSELIHDYGALLAEERRLAKYKERLRTAIVEEMERRNLKQTRNVAVHGSEADRAGP